MKILITNATGRIGRCIVRELLAPEFSVRVLTPKPERLPEEIRERVQVIPGSSDDAAILRQALEGVEAMFWCVPGESRAETKVEQYYQRFAHAARQAIRDARTPRVVAISACGKASMPHSGVVSGLRAMEEPLNESGASVRHLRCGFFMENFLSQLPSICSRGLISYPIPGGTPIPMTAAADIADAALRRLVRQDWDGVESDTIRGTDLSFNQAAATMERFLQRPLRYQEASANQYVAALVESGASAEYAHGQVEMFSALAAEITDPEPELAESTVLTTLAAWTQKELLPLVDSFHSRSGPDDNRTESRVRQTRSGGHEPEAWQAESRDSCNCREYPIRDNG